MRHVECRLAKLAGIAGIFSCAGAGHSASAQTAAYQVHLLPPFDYTIRASSAAYAINNSGLVVGEGSTSEGGLRAARWEPGVTTPTQLGGLSTDPRYNVSRAYSVNDAGDVGGRARVAPPNLEADAYHPVRWASSGTSAQELATLGTTGAAWQLRIGDAAYGMDAAGNGLGNSTRFTSFGGLRGAGAASWGPDGSATVFATLSADPTNTTYDFIHGANAAGWAVGNSNSHPARWTPRGTSVVQLAGSALDGGNAGANAINIHGDSVGNVYENNLMVAALWPANGTSLVELGDLDPALGATANAINAGGYAVGSASILDGDVTTSHAVMWVPGGTSAIDLNSLIDPLSGWVLNEARGINDAGLIVGTGSFDPDGAGPLPTLSLAFRLDPVPEPSALATIAVIVTGTCLKRRNSRGVKSGRS